MSGFAFGDEYDAAEDEPTGEETPAELAALEQRKIQKAHERQAELAAANGLQPLPIPVAPSNTGAPNADAAADLAQRLVAQFTQPTPVTQPQNVEQALETTEDRYMDLVDKRLQIASYYRTLLNGHLFAGDTCEEAMTVEYEVKGFVRERLAVLLNVASDKVAGKEIKQQLSDFEVDVVKQLSSLSADQIYALKLLADKMVAAGALAPDEPEPTPAPAPVAAPVRRPATQQRPLPPPPAVVQRRPAAPQLAVRQGPPPVDPPPAAPRAPAQQPQQEQEQEQPRRGPGRPPGSRNKPKSITVEKELPDGTIVEVEVQRTQRPAGMIPFPTREQIGYISEQQAVAAAASRVAAPGVARAIQGIANTPSNEE